MNLFIYINFYFLIFFSIIGYGLFFKRLFLNKNELSLGYCGIYGIFLLIIISYFSNIFVPQNNLFNSIILILGTSYFFYFLFQKKLFRDKDFFLLLAIFLLLIVFILSAKPHDDFPYYHFPYIHLLTSETSSLGIGIFRSISESSFLSHASVRVLKPYVS